MRKFNINEKWETMLDYGIASEDAMRLVTNINGYNESTLDDIIDVQTGYKTFEDWYEET